MRKQSPDQLVPGQPVKFVTDEAAQTILAGLRTQYDSATTYASQQTVLAEKCQAEMDVWSREIEDRQREIRERQAWIEQRQLEMRQAHQAAQQGYDVAKGAADLLAHLGAPVPTPAGELSLTPEGSLGRFNAATDEQRAAEGSR